MSTPCSTCSWATRVSPWLGRGAAGMRSRIWALGGLGGPAQLHVPSCPCRLLPRLPGRRGRAAPPPQRWPCAPRPCHPLPHLPQHRSGTCQPGHGGTRAGAPCLSGPCWALRARGLGAQGWERRRRSATKLCGTAPGTLLPPGCGGRWCQQVWELPPGQCSSCRPSLSSDVEPSS